ncbi:MAG: YebC/PmpR family DNA-binding transcriptional regulator, partial [Desulfuromonadales bacterium]
MSASGLKAAIEKAKAVDMPNDNIERSIKKAMGADAEDMETITYEAYGPEGIAIIIDVLTSNRNKAAAEVKHILLNNGSIPPLLVLMISRETFHILIGSYYLKVGGADEQVGNYVENCHTIGIIDGNDSVGCRSG